VGLVGCGSLRELGVLVLRESSWISLIKRVLGVRAVAGGAGNSEGRGSPPFIFFLQLTEEIQIDIENE